MSLPVYPEFRPIILDDFDAFRRAFLDTVPSISEFTFTNLYSWRQAYKLQVSILEGRLILRSDSTPEHRFFSPIGRGDTREIMKKIIADSRGIFIRIPEEVKQIFDHAVGWQAILDTDNADYLFRSEDLINLEGKKYDGKRNLIKKFKSSFAYTYLDLDQTNKEECLDFEENWCTIKDCDNVQGLDNERRAIRQMIENYSRFELIGGAIKVEGQIRAVTIAQRLNPQTMVMHVLKADPNIPGLYQTINQEFLSRHAKNFLYINMEQDLGVEGLRKAKLSYQPVAMINKYTLRFKN